jgi:hypothetical protein
VITESVLPAAKAAPHLPANWPGWAVIIAIGLLLLSWLLKILKG